MRKHPTHKEYAASCIKHVELTFRQRYKQSKHKQDQVLREIFDEILPNDKLESVLTENRLITSILDDAGRELKTLDNSREVLMNECKRLDVELQNIKSSWRYKIAFVPVWKLWSK